MWCRPPVFFEGQLGGWEGEAVGKGGMNKGLLFIDRKTGRWMQYVHPKSGGQYAGWLLYRNPGDGQWVTLRKATEEDLEAIRVAARKVDRECEARQRAKLVMDSATPLVFSIRK